MGSQIFGMLGPLGIVAILGTLGILRISGNSENIWESVGIVGNHRNPWESLGIFGNSEILCKRRRSGHREMYQTCKNGQKLQEKKRTLRAFAYAS